MHYLQNPLENLRFIFAVKWLIEEYQVYNENNSDNINERAIVLYLSRHRKEYFIARQNYRWQFSIFLSFGPEIVSTFARKNAERPYYLSKNYFMEFIVKMNEAHYNKGVKKTLKR